MFPVLDNSISRISTLPRFAKGSTIS